MNIAKDHVVLLHYVLKDDQGAEIDRSEPDSPLAYLHGHGQIIQGLETALLGKTVGEHLDVSVSAEEGYGERDPRLDVSIPVSIFPENIHSQLQPGVAFSSPDPRGGEEPVYMTISAIEDGQVLASGNHPLAGQALHFSVDVAEIREATEDEMTHGHAHGPGGAHHE
jgi:FKBP-type peptidyl-prolyl cis-trans isomerase SlyD